METEQMLMKAAETIERIAKDQDKNASVLEEMKQSQRELQTRLDEIELKGDAPRFSGKSPAGFEARGMERYLRTGDLGDLDRKAMEITTDASGGYLHIPELGREIVKAIGEINPLVADAGKITTSANVYQQVFSTSRSANGRAAEKDTRSETNTATFAQTEVTLYELYAYPKITLELAESTQFNLAEWLRNDVVESFAETLETELVSGSGTKSSKGILTAATSESTDSASPQRAWGVYQILDRGINSPISSFNYNSLVDLVHSLAVRYRRNAKFYMSTNAIQTARKLVGSDGQPIWKDATGGIAAAPQTLLGYPVVEVPAMPDVALNTKPVMFGDLSKAYAVVSHSGGLGIIRDPITSPGWLKFYVRQRLTGYPMDTRALKVLRVAP